MLDYKEYSDSIVIIMDGYVSNDWDSNMLNKRKYCNDNKIINDD